jgi:hypothetical protein
MGKTVALLAFLSCLLAVGPSFRAAGSPLFRPAPGAAGEVSADSLGSYIRHLSAHPDGTPRTRMYLRDETGAEALPYLEGQLRRFLTAPGDSVWRQPFPVSWREGDTLYTKDVDNCIGLHRGLVGGGAYILCGHYDTTARRSPSWNWTDDPAPGADDNATGVAAILDCARVLGARTFDFDIRFVFFTAEEYGLKGSEFYVERALADGDSILGVINVDMIGYDPLGHRTVVVMSNDRSEWIGDWLVEVEGSLGLALAPLAVEMPGHMVGRSDHAHFVLEGFPVVSLWENLEGDSSEFNPHYHTLGDTAGYLSIPLVQDITSVFTGALAALGEPGTDPDFSVPENGVIVRPAGVEAGEPVTVLAVVRNLGPATDGPVSFLATVREGPSGGPFRVVATRAVDLDLPAGTWKYVSVPWTPSGGTMGLREVRVTVTAPAGMDSDPGNDEGSREFLAEAAAQAVFDVYAYPNPVRFPEHSLEDLTFHYQLSHGMDVTLTVFTLEGEEVAAFERRHDPHSEGDGTSAGPNEVAWTELDGRPGTLAPGLYLVSVDVDGGEDRAFGKFAVIR